MTALRAGETTAEVSDVLLAVADVEGCGRTGSRRCRSLLETAAWTRVSAVRVLRCTRPGVFALRNDLRLAIDALLEGDGLDQPPPLPSCG